jgi:hypothetical protein
MSTDRPCPAHIKRHAHSEGPEFEEALRERHAIMDADHVANPWQAAYVSTCADFDVEPRLGVDQ